MGEYFTLGTGATGAICVDVAVDYTLGDTSCVLYDYWIGIGWIRFNYVAKVKSEFPTRSPASKLGVVVDWGDVNIVIILVVAWHKKSYNFVAWNGTWARKM